MEMMMMFSLMVMMTMMVMAQTWWKTVLTCSISASVSGFTFKENVFELNFIFQSFTFFLISVGLGILIKFV